MEKFYKRIISIIFINFLFVSVVYAGYHNKNREELKDKNVSELNVENYYGVWIPDEKNENCQNLINKTKEVIKKNIYIYTYENSPSVRIENPVYRFNKMCNNSNNKCDYFFDIFTQDDFKKGKSDWSFELNDDLIHLVTMKTLYDCPMIRIPE